MPVTNVLERLNGEVKRRAHVVGIFPNENAITRLVGAILLEQNGEYAIGEALHESGIAGDDERESADQVTGHRRSLIELTRRKPDLPYASLLYHSMGHNRGDTDGL
jgi:Transposase, Mutator family